jgi:hypothetical protein
MADFFQFEADFVESLRCIPMQVRYKLDTCGIKLKLAQWNRFSQTECQSLVERPCETEAEVQSYRQFLQALVLQRTGAPVSELPIDPQPDWAEPQVIPASVQTKADAANVVISLTQWQALTPLQRFALIKLSRSGHENNNFLPALQEFGLLS